MELVEFRFTQSRRASLDYACDDASNGITVGFNLGNEVFHLLGFSLVRTTYRIVFDGVEVILMVIFLQSDVSHLRCVGSDADAQLAECQLGKGATHAA